jgi:O-antigen/teichoic acid export membrane protein
MMMPVFAVDFFQNNLGELRRKYFLVVRVTAVAALYGGGMIVLLGRMFILRWMGPQFEQSYPVLVVLMLAMVFEVIGNGSDNMLFALNKHRYLAFASVAEAAVNFVLSVLLIGPYGLVGVAVGTAVPLVLSRAVVIPQLTMTALQLPLWSYYRNLAPAVLFAGGFVGATAWVTSGHLAPPSYLTIVVIAAAASPLYLLGAFYVVFDATERAFVAGALPPWMARRLPGIAAA